MCNFTYAQVSHDEAIKAFLPQSYIMYPLIVNTSDKQTIEAQLNEHIYFRITHLQRIAFVFSPSITLRLVADSLFALRPISINPKFTMIYRVKCSQKNTVRYLNLTTGYDFNGHRSPKSNSKEINEQTDGFSTLYFQLGRNSAHPFPLYGPSTWFMLNQWAFQYHPKQFMDEKMIGNYEQYRFVVKYELLNNSYKISGSEKRDEITATSSKPDMRISLSVTALLDRFSFASFKQGHSISAYLQYSIRPLRKVDYALFVRLYYGMDYYIGFGVISQHLNMPIFLK